MEPALEGGPSQAFDGATSIAAHAATVSLEDAAALVLRYYGLAAEPGRLIGERDQNFRLRGADGRQWALKLIHPAEDPGVTDFQTKVLLRMEAADPAIPAQRVVPTLSGASQQAVALPDGSRRMMRLTTFLPGVIVRGLPPSPRRSFRLGRLLAQVQRALDGFAHPFDGHEIAWDIRHTARQRAVVPEMETPEKRALMTAGLDRFDARAAALLPGLRAQVVHNDLSNDNLVVDPRDHDRIAGILDFGDACRTAVVNDIAIGIAYNTVEGDDLLSGAVPFLAGFGGVKPVLDDELDLLLDLVIARFVVRVGITEWRGRRFADNAGYILRSTPEAWRILKGLLAIDPARARDIFHAATTARTSTWD